MANKHIIAERSYSGRDSLRILNRYDKAAKGI